MKRLLVIFLIFVTQGAFADKICNELLSGRLESMMKLDLQTAQKTVVLTRKILNGERPWLFWGERKNPWVNFEGQRVLVVLPLNGTFKIKDPSLSMTFQNVMSSESFIELFPELQTDISAILNLSLRTGYEWGVFVFAVRDHLGQVRLLANLLPFTSKSPSSIRAGELTLGMSSLVSRVQAEIPEGASEWEVLEMWNIHTHPGGFSPISNGDAIMTRMMFESVLFKSLRFRMIAITTKDPTVFSLARDATEPKMYFKIDKKNGWRTELIQP